MLFFIILKIWDRFHLIKNYERHITVAIVNQPDKFPQLIFKLYSVFSSQCSDCIPSYDVLYNCHKDFSHTNHIH